jgi:hypothetical protein
MSTGMSMLRLVNKNYCITYLMCAVHKLYKSMISYAIRLFVYA